MYPLPIETCVCMLLCYLHVCRYRAGRTLWACFHAWTDLKAELSHSRLLAERSKQAYDASILQHTFSTWAAAAADSKAMAVEKTLCELASETRAHRHAAKRLQCNAFLAWSSLSSALKYSRCLAEERGRSAVLALAFEAWSEAIADANSCSGVELEVAMKRASVWHARRVLGMAVRCWRDIIRWAGHASCQRCMSYHMSELN